MNMVSMGASMISAVVALGALAYAFTLEARILTNDARSLSTCEAVSFSFFLNQNHKKRSSDKKSEFTIFVHIIVV